ncbi:hypothetical protein CN514_05875 [Bacillus sp. AFS001701]|uniref:hypothetical protein n=1 Tax=Bacillus sp. AFS001701 TaxID=2033480 RepID=UPI000BFB100E|nr:hypothetical protein [Bacillus sp. AFS001701]PET71781.1 hypothetical protein CN514_05875 [Bacillus sp. AFS001701]
MMHQHEDDAFYSNYTEINKFEPSKNVLFNFHTEDIDAAYNFMTKNNITIVKEIECIGEFAYFNFEDLDGIVFKNW